MRSIANTLPDDWLLFHTKSMLGEALVGQGKYDAAEPLLLDGYEGVKARLESVPGARNLRLAEGIQRLVTLYTKWEKLDDAAKWSAILDSTTMMSKE